MVPYPVTEVEALFVFTPGMGVHVVGRVGGLANATGRQICQYTVVAEPPVTVAPKTSVPPFKTDSDDVGDDVALVNDEPAAETVTPIVVPFPPQLETTAARNTAAIKPKDLIQRLLESARSMY